MAGLLCLARRSWYWEEMQEERVESRIWLERYHPQPNFTFLRGLSEREGSGGGYGKWCIYSAIRWLRNTLNHCVHAVWSLRAKKKPWADLYMYLLYRSYEYGNLKTINKKSIKTTNVRNWTFSVTPLVILPKVDKADGAFKSSSKPISCEIRLPPEEEVVSWSLSPCLPSSADSDGPGQLELVGRCCLRRLRDLCDRNIFWSTNSLAPFCRREHRGCEENNKG